MNFKKFSLIVAICLLIALAIVLIIRTSLTGMVVAPIASDYLLLELNYTNGNSTLVNTSYYSGNPQEFSTSKEYELKLIDYLGVETYSLNFDPSNLYTDGGEEELNGGLVELNSSLIYLVIPRFYQAEKIVIAKDGINIFGAEVYDEASSCRIA